MTVTCLIQPDQVDTIDNSCSHFFFQVFILSPYMVLSWCLCITIPEEFQDYWRTIYAQDFDRCFKCLLQPFSLINNITKKQYFKIL